MMFGLDIVEILFIVLIAMVFLKPEDLPKAFRRLGRFYAQMTHMKKTVVNTIKEIETETNVRIVPPREEGDEASVKEKGD
ncbi:MAG: hypothetical protein JW881_15840 [Spirochaetales bacterium]|nr:hypothetical protein [Spirochaetales bacterium]